jgi:hypothetical protein
MPFEAETWQRCILLAARCSQHPTRADQQLIDNTSQLIIIVIEIIIALIIHQLIDFN